MKRRVSDFLKRYSKIRGEDYGQNLLLEGRIAAQSKTRRKSLNMPQQDLADLAGVPTSTIGRIEAGLTSPKARYFMANI